MSSIDPWELVASWTDERVKKLKADAAKAEKAYSPESKFGQACQAYAHELRISAAALADSADRFRELATRTSGAAPERGDGQ